MQNSIQSAKPDNTGLFNSVIQATADSTMLGSKIDAINKSAMNEYLDVSVPMPK